MQLGIDWSALTQAASQVLVQREKVRGEIAALRAQEEARRAAIERAAKLAEAERAAWASQEGYATIPRPPQPAAPQTNLAPWLLGLAGAALLAVLLMSRR